MVCVMITGIGVIGMKDDTGVRHQMNNTSANIPGETQI